MPIYFLFSLRAFRPSLRVTLMSHKAITAKTIANKAIDNWLKFIYLPMALLNFIAASKPPIMIKVTQTLGSVGISLNS